MRLSKPPNTHKKVPARCNEPGLRAVPVGAAAVRTRPVELAKTPGLFALLFAAYFLATLAFALAISTSALAPKSAYSGLTAPIAVMYGTSFSFMAARSGFLTE